MGPANTGPAFFMAINEAGCRRSNLTKEQKRQAEAAIYGLSETYMPTQSGQFSNEEIEHMRNILTAHDQAAGKGIQEFDLNKPPQQPYVHQEFPRIMYHHGKRIYRSAANAEEMQAALDSGWKKEPYPPEGAEPEEIQLDPESAREVESINEKLRTRRAARQQKPVEE